jgi:hypothetical protein
MKLTSTATRLYSVFVALVKDPPPRRGPLVGWAEWAAVSPGRLVYSIPTWRDEDDQVV